jgi:hypothetical protein
VSAYTFPTSQREGKNKGTEKQAMGRGKKKTPSPRRKGKGKTTIQVFQNNNSTISCLLVCHFLHASNILLGGGGCM